MGPLEWCAGQQVGQAPVKSATMARKPAKRRTAAASEAPTHLRVPTCQGAQQSALSDVRSGRHPAHFEAQPRAGHGTQAIAVTHCLWAVVQAQ